MQDHDSAHPLRSPVFSRKPTMTYEELENLYLQGREESGRLKKDSNLKDDLLKQMNTKLQRLTVDLKKSNSPGGVSTRGPRRRDVETEEMIQNLNSRLNETERENDQLQHAVQLLNQQMLSQASFSGRVDRKRTVTKKLVPLVNTAQRPSKRKRTSASIPSSSLGGMAPVSRYNINLEGGTNVMANQRLPPDKLVEILISNPASTVTQSSNQETLQEAIYLLLGKYLQKEGECKGLNDEMGGVKEKLSRQEDDHRRQLEQKRGEYERELDLVHQRERENKNRDLQLEEELSSLQKQLRDKTSEASGLKHALESKDTTLDAVKENHRVLLSHTGLMNDALKEERQKNLRLEEKVKDIEGDLDTRGREMESLRREREQVLSASRPSKGFDEELFGEKERELERERRKYREKSEEIDGLEKALRDAKNEKERMAEENEVMRGEKRALQRENGESEAKVKELQQRMDFFLKEAGTREGDMSELKEALTVVKMKKSGLMKERLDDDEREELETLRMDNSSLVAEIEKLRRMLKLQQDINNALKKETEEAKMETQRVEVEYQNKLNDEARLVDIKAEQIRKLENRLDDFIYKRIVEADKDKDFNFAEDEDEDGKALSLEPDENIIEIQVIMASLASDLPEELVTFVNVDFYEHEIAITPPVSGKKPTYNVLLRYKVKMNDDLLAFLHGRTTTFEINAAHGVDFSQLGGNIVSFRELIERNANNSTTGKIFGTTELLSFEDSTTVVATLQYSVRMWKSMKEEIRLWKAKTMGMSLMEDDAEARYQRHMLGAPKNELVIKVNGCRGLLPKGTKEAPYAYITYCFFHYPDHETTTVHSSDPVFDDTQSYSVVISDQLEEYLISEKMSFYAFDDNDITGDFFFGSTEVPLASLLHDNAIRGDFSLVDQKGQANGSVNIELHWRRPYKRIALLDQERKRAQTAPEDSKGGLLQLADVPADERDFVGTQNLSDAESYDSHWQRTQSASMEMRSPPRMKEYDQGEYERRASPLLPTPTKGRATPMSGRRPPSRAITKTTTQSWSKKRFPDMEEEIPRDRRRKRMGEFPEDEEERRAPLLRDANGLDLSENIVISIKRLELESSWVKSHLGVTASTVNIFVGFEFLRYPISDLETTSALLREESGIYSIDYEGPTDFTRIFPVIPNRYQLYSMINSGNREDAEVIFDVMSEATGDRHGHQVAQCKQLGTAEVNLLNLLDLDQDLPSQDIGISDRYKGLIGTLIVSVHAVQALKNPEIPVGENQHHIM